MHGYRIGPAPERSTISLYVRLAGRHDTELESLADAIQTPGSASYGRYLTPEQFGRYFGAPPAQYASAIALLRAHGFTIESLPVNHTDIVVHAPVAAVASFFATPIDLRRENGRTFFANRYDPVFPAGLHAVAVSGLDDYYRLHSMLRRNPNVAINNTFNWGPADVAAAYDLNSLYSHGIDGRGVTIANATCGAAIASDLAMFQKQFGLPASRLITTGIGGAPHSGCAGQAYSGSPTESSLDAQWALAIARNATLHQVVNTDGSIHQFDLVYSYIVNKLGSTVHVVTTSWGDCEQVYKTDQRSSLTIDEKLFAQAVIEGQHWFAASGDTGVADCQNVKGDSVDFPGSSPYVMSVGGTNVKGNIVHGNVTGWAGETTWQYANSNGASGGGRSILYKKPAYQKGITPNDHVRDVPDVALIADDVNDGLWVVQGNYLYNGNGGTSEAAPQWAGFLALVEQKYKNKVIPDPHARLYALARTHAYHSLFHDITVGNNSVQNNYGTWRGYNAGPGFDLTTGVGSFIGAALENAY